MYNDMETLMQRRGYDEIIVPVSETGPFRIIHCSRCVGETSAACLKETKMKILCLLIVAGALLVTGKAFGEDGGCFASDPVFVQRDARQPITTADRLGGLGRGAKATADAEPILGSKRVEDPLATSSLAGSRSMLFVSALTFSMSTAILGVVLCRKTARSKSAARKALSS